MSYSPHFIRCRLCASYSYDPQAREIGFRLVRADTGDSLRVAFQAADAMRLLMYWLNDLAAAHSPEDSRSMGEMSDAIGRIIDRAKAEAAAAPSASKLYDEATRITTVPADGLEARLAELESAASTLQTSVDTIQDDVSSIRGTIEALERGLGEINAVFYGNEPASGRAQGPQS